MFSLRDDFWGILVLLVQFEVHVVLQLYQAKLDVTGLREEDVAAFDMPMQQALTFVNMLHGKAHLFQYFNYITLLKIPTWSQRHFSNFISQIAIARVLLDHKIIHFGLENFLHLNDVRVHKPLIHNSYFKQFLILVFSLYLLVFSHHIFST